MEMNKIWDCIIFVIFKISWKKSLISGVIITITFAFFQIRTLHYQLTSRNPYITNHHNVNPHVFEFSSRTPSPMQSAELIKPLSTATRGTVVKLPKPRAKDPNKREMNMKEKQNLGLALQNVPQKKMPQLLQIIRKWNNQVGQEGDEIEVDIEAFDTETLWELDRFVTNWKKAVSKTKRRNSALAELNRSANIDDVLGSDKFDGTPSQPFSLSTSERRKRYLRDITTLSADEALVYAKKEVNAVSTGNEDHDPTLYAPLFRNVSLFERSYELMELILKVYIYQDGKKPIFHTPYLRGIYSSEGWFMKFMEASRQFVTRDPEKAHLFYLPYSARQLQRALYVPDSHDIKPLSLFLRDYVNKLASKYPFWNRTHGSDHFLVACHDWGPYTLTEHEELTKNSIKSLCNADTSEGVFVAGKDVSLPETTIGNPRRPLRNMGGKKISQRPTLAFFAGRMHGRVRPTLIKHWANKDEKMIISGPMSYKTSSYSLHMKSSKYCICPMGFEVNSPRIVEAIYYECVPVIIADDFVPPLNEVLNWSAFSVIVAENDIPKLKEILLAIPMKRYRTMQSNVKMLQRHFYWNRTPVKYDMFHMILHSIWLSRLNQIHI